MEPTTKKGEKDCVDWTITRALLTPPWIKTLKENMFFHLLGYFLNVMIISWLLFGVDDLIMSLKN